MQHQVTENWSLTLPDDGEGELTDDGELVVRSEGMKIVVATWNAAAEVEPDGLLAELKAAERPDPRAEFDEHGPDGTLRWASLVDENDDGRPYVGLYAYVLAQDEWLQLAVLYDDPHDHDVALMLWRSVRHHPVTIGA